jgi:hypothetical protein
MIGGTLLQPGGTDKKAGAVKRKAFGGGVKCHGDSISYWISVVRD